MQLDINQTVDYDIFKFSEGNREKISASHVNELVESMKICDKHHLFPVIVKSDMTIINGQHRVLARKKMGLPVMYIIDNDYQEGSLVSMNAGKGWKLSDYLHYWCSMGNEEYIKLKKFIEKWNIPLRSGTSLYGRCSHMEGKNFRNGKFKMSEVPSDGTMLICQLTVGQVKHGTMKKECSFLSSTAFLQALVEVIEKEGFIASKWIEKLKKFRGKICIQTGRKAYVEMLMSIYNYNERAEDRIH